MEANQLKKEISTMENQLKATELRCGNLIYRYDKVVHTNIGILTKIQNGSVIYKPIPLTEDILLRLGFEKHFISNFILDYKGFRFDFAGGRVFYLNGRKLEHTKYVHQLQNLFFSLTGEELTFKK